MMWGHDTWSASVTLMTLMMLAVTVVAVGLTVWVVRGLMDDRRHPRLAGGRDRTRPGAYDAAEQVLAHRFAQGRIDEVQYDRARAALRRDRPDDPRA